MGHNLKLGNLNSISNRLLRLKFYLFQLSEMLIDPRLISIIDLIESPIDDLTSLLEPFDQKQKALCMQIRQKERSNCKNPFQDEDALPPSDPLEIEYQKLKAQYAEKLKELERQQRMKIENEENLQMCKDNLAKLRRQQMNN